MLTRRSCAAVEWDVLGKYSWILTMLGAFEEQKGVAARQEELKNEPSINRDPISVYLMVRASLHQSPVRD